jgi:hypothetical protein
MEINQGTLVVMSDVEIIGPETRCGGGPLGEEIGLVLGVNNAGTPFVRSRSYKGLWPKEKVIPICQTELVGSKESEKSVCSEDGLNKLILKYLPQIFASLMREIADIKKQTAWLADNKVHRGEDSSPQFRSRS